jgi:hypothetical protein
MELRFYSLQRRAASYRDRTLRFDGRHGGTTRFATQV